MREPDYCACNEAGQRSDSGGRPVGFDFYRFNDASFVDVDCVCLDFGLLVECEKLVWMSKVNPCVYLSFWYDQRGIERGHVADWRGVNIEGINTCFDAVFVDRLFDRLCYPDCVHDLSCWCLRELWGR